MSDFRSLYRGVFFAFIAFASGCMSGPLPMLKAEEWSTFSAVGVIRSVGASGATLCSGTLVACDLVVTPVHCIRKDALLMRNVEFMAGMAHGRFVAQSGSIDVLQHLVWNWTKERKRYLYDAAVVRLSRPISSSKVVPLRLTAADQTMNERRALVGYAGRKTASAVRGRFDRALFDFSKHGLFISDCTTTRGNSGGAVLTEGQNGWELAGVIVATKRDTKEAVVVELDDWLRQHVAEALEREAFQLAQLQ